MDFRNNMQKVYVSEEEKDKFMEKLNRDVEVSFALTPPHRPVSAEEHVWASKAALISLITFGLSLSRAALLSCCSSFW